MSAAHGESPSPISLRILHAPKDGNDDGQYEDACAHTPVENDPFTIALADGASSAIFAREWAAILTGAFGLGESYPEDDRAFLEIVAGLGQQWRREVEVKATTWHAQEKLSSGSSATLLVVEIDRGAQSFIARAVGDVCLFLIRGDRLRYAFPVTKSARFGDRPELLSTETSASRPKIVRFSARIEPGDRLLMMTDASAAWFLGEWERKRKPWNELPESEDALGSWLKARRNSGALKNDDVTMVEVGV